MRYEPGVEHFGEPKAPAEACRSLATWLGTDEAEARSLLERGGAVGAIETRGQSWRCGGCGAGKLFGGQYCQCNWPGSDTAVRNKPMPHQCMDGMDAAAMTRRRYIDPSMLAG